MKQYCIIPFLCLLISCENHHSEELERCFPDIGIKTARTTGYIASDPSSEDKSAYQEVHYAEDGQPELIINSVKGSKSRWIYKNGRLHSIISMKKEASDFFQENHFDSSNENVDYRQDTGFVLSYHMDGRPKQMDEVDGNTLFMEYTACTTEIHTWVNEIGDTFDRTILKNENGVLVEREWITFDPEKISSTTKYYGYEFNERGHWIKRNFTHQEEGLIIERRKLTYY